MNITGFLTIVAMIVLIGTTTSTVYAQYGGGPPQSSVGDYTVSIKSDKDSYSVGDTISLSGSVSKYDETRIVASYNF